MSTLIGRFNELLHHLSSSTSSASAVSPTHQPSQPPPPPPSSRPSANSRTSSGGSHHVHRHASLSAADRPTPVRRSNSASRTKQTTTGANNKSTSSSSRGVQAKATEDQTDGHRSRHRSTAPTSSHQHNSQRQSNQSSSRRESSGSRRDSASSILHHHHQSRRAPLTSSRRRHSIASLSSVNGPSLAVGATKKPSTPSNGPVMASKVSKKSSAVSHKNNNNNNTVSAKTSVIKQQQTAAAPTAVNGDSTATATESDESLASKFARKMKISAITRKGSNCNSATAAKIVNGVKGSDQQKKQAKTNKKGQQQAEADSKNGENGCFIYRYLNGHLVKQHPDIISGKTCYDLPIKDIEALETKVVASCTGPSGGLLTVDCTPPKPFDLAGDEVDFIDEDYPDSSLSSAGAELSPPTPKSSVSTVSSDVGETLPSSSENASPVNEFEGHHLHASSIEGESTPIAGIADWTREKDFAYGISTSLYESHPSTKQHAGDPIADSFAVCVRENSSIIALADGVNWGEKACLASRCAVYGCMDYLNKALYSPAESTRIRNTLDIFVALLRSFNAAHDLILAQGGHLTTLCAAVICQLRNSDRFIVCTCNVGDSLAYVYSPLYGVREITAASHDIFSMRDMRDALGALGPVSGKEPELNNLTVAMTVVDVGDIVFLTSDGISDNFDPVVGKFAMPKKAPETKTGVTPEAEGEKATAATAATVKSKDNKQANKESEKSVKARKAVQRSNSNPERGASRKLPPLNPDNYTAKGLPLVSAQQRHELTLLRMEDLIMNGVNSISVYNSSLKKTAKELCTLMLDFSSQLTMAKRRILEDPELYSDSEQDLSGSEVFGKQRQRRRLVGHKLVQVPGKLDHASIAAVEIGFYGSIAAKRASLYHMQQPTHKPFKSSNKDNTRTTTHSTSNGRAIREEDSRYNLKMKAPVARFESQDFLECCCEAGPI